MAINKKFRLGGDVENAFTIFQTDFGTSPTADSATDTLTLTSSDGSVTITGSATTDTIDLSVTAFALSIESNGSEVDANVDTLDFSTEFTLAESPENDIDISLNLGAIDHDSLLNTHNLTTDIDHDQTTNYVASEHVDSSLLVLRDGSQDMTADWDFGGVDLTNVEEINVNSKIEVGDFGSESAGININGTTYASELRANDIGGSSPALFHLHRHSTTIPAVMVGSRANDDTSSHTAVTTGQSMFDIIGAGWTGSHYDIFGDIRFRSAASGTISSTSSPGLMRFRVTPDGSNAPQAVLDLLDDRSSKFYGNLTIGTGAAATDYTLTFDGETNDGVITWMEDEDYFALSDDIFMNSSERTYYRASGQSVYSSGANYLDLDAVTGVNVRTGGTRRIEIDSDQLTFNPDAANDCGFQWSDSILNFQVNGADEIRFQGNQMIMYAPASDPKFNWATGSTLKTMIGNSEVTKHQSSTFVISQDILLTFEGHATDPTAKAGYMWYSETNYTMMQGAGTAYPGKYVKLTHSTNKLEEDSNFTSFTYRDFSHTVPAFTIPAAGRTMRVTAGGQINTSKSPSVEMHIEFGGSKVLEVVVGTVDTGGSIDDWWFDSQGIIYEGGGSKSSSTVNWSGMMMIGTKYFAVDTVNKTSITTDKDSTIDLIVKFSAANASDAFQFSHAALTMD